MAKLRKTNNKRPLIVIPIIGLVSLTMLLTYSFANFKSIKLFNIIGSIASFGHKYTISYDNDNCTSKELNDGDEFGELCLPSVLDGYEFMGWYYNGNKITADTIFNFKKNIELTAYIVPECDSKIGTVYNFSYTGSPQEFKHECPGVYTIELWGAQGGSSRVNGSSSGNSAYGGYTKGDIYLESNQNLYVYVGNQGTNAATRSNSAAAWNGGGSGTWDNSDDESSGGGGGATDVRYFGDVTPSDSDLAWNSALGLNSRIMVAGASGGKSFNYNGGGGGGLNGYNSSGANAGTQTSGAAFGIGRNGSGTADSDGVAGGGGGYYGGISNNTSGKSSGAGGSSYISGHAGCIAIAADATNNPRTIKAGCSASSNSIECSTHYSGLAFTNTKMIDGQGYVWTTVKGAREQMPNPSGGVYNSGVGRKGAGYARITYVSKNPKFIVSFDVNGGTGGQSANVEATFDDNMPTISTTAPTKNNMEFQGWYDNANYKEGIKYYNADGTSARKFDKSSNLTLYAGWDTPSYTVTFDFADGSYDGETTKKIRVNEAYGSLPVPYKTGYIFSSWQSKNLINIGWQQSEPSNTDFMDSARTFIPNSYVLGLSNWNTYSPYEAVDLEVGTNRVKFYTEGGYGIAFPFKGLEQTAYTSSATCLTYDGECITGALYYDSNGNYISDDLYYHSSGSGNIEKTFTPPANALYTVVLFTTNGEMTDVEFTNIQLEKGSSKTEYQAYGTILENTIVTTAGNHTLYANYIGLSIGDSWNYNYTDTIQTFKAPVSGTYQLEVWGAEGGAGGVNASGGLGGYAKGNIALNTNDTVYIVVGGAGEDAYDAGNLLKKQGYEFYITRNGYNANASGYAYNNLPGQSGGAGGGGGATHIATKTGLLHTLSDGNDMDKVIIVAGGGGGGASSNDGIHFATGGAGGGGDATSYNGISCNVGGSDAINAYLGHGATSLFGTTEEYITGAGGGGFYGGKTAPYCGGGGGTNYTGSLTSTATETGIWSGNGKAKITYLGS